MFRVMHTTLSRLTVICCSCRLPNGISHSLAGYACKPHELAIVWRTKSRETLQNEKVSDTNLFLRKFLSDELGQDLAKYATRLFT
jgi:hypothetical protein